MSRSRWQMLIALGGLLLIGLLLAWPTGGQGPPAGAGGTPELTAAPTPPVGGLYTEALVGSPQRLNPLLESYSQVDRDLERLIFSGLIRFDSTGRPQGDLAESWSVNPDGLTYTFSLRPDLRWHDDVQVTTDDVTFTLSLVQDPRYPGPAELHNFWKDVKVTALNPLTVQFTLPEPYAPFLDQLSLGLLPRHLLDGVQPSALPELDFNLRPTGTGPFQLMQLTGSRAGAGITGAELRPFPGYYGKKPLLSELRFRFYPDQAAALRAYQAGEVDGLARLDGPELAAALSDPSLNLYTSREPRLTLVFLNLGDDNLPFFRDKQVRHALLYGLNRQWMVDNLLGGQAMVAESPILPGNWAYDHSYPPTPYDPARAAELLDAAGWLTPPGTAPGDLTYVRAKDGRELSFTILAGDDPLHASLANTIQQNLALLGVRTGVRALPGGELFSQHVQPRAYEAALVDINLSRYPDPDPYPFWHQTQAQSGQNYGQLNERSLSEALELARITPRLEDRAKLYRTFQSRFAGLTPALLLYYPVYNYAVSANVAGITLGPLVDPSDRFNTVANWRLRTP